MPHYYEEESHFYHTLFDFKNIVDMYGDRVWAELEKHSPTVYEAFCAYKANQDIEEFVSVETEKKWKDICDYWKDEKND